MKIGDDLLMCVDERIVPTLIYRDVPNPKLLVTFSGPASVGKSTVAKQLERRLHAVRFENDAVRTLAAEWYPDSTAMDRTRLAHVYSEHVWTKMAREIPNGLWVVDSSLDRSYEIVFRAAKEFGFEVFVIAIDIPEDLHREWIIAGGDRPFSTMSAYLNGMGRARQEQAAFLAKHTPDVTISPPYDVNMLVDVIGQRLAALGETIPGKS